MAGVSVRTLHHYDHIGLLTPSARSEAGYRLYAEADLLRLQQILFFKELDFPLGEIRSILDHPGFDQVAALHNHRRLLEARAERLTLLLHTIDETIRRLTEDDTMLTDAELYAGFSDEQIERYRREARERWGDVVEETEQRVRHMSRDQWQAVGQEGEEVTRALAGLMDRAPGDPEVQGYIARHHAWIEHFYPASAELYRGLGQLYVEHEEFRKYYDKYAPGMADFMLAAMTYYADHSLEE
jgi:DNA-binding transcriptional MerR regulator